MCCKNKILSYCEMDEEWNQETAEKSLPLKVDYEIFVGLAVFCIIVLAMSFILVKYCLLDENILILRKNKVLRTLKSIVENLKSIFGMNQSQSMTCTCYFDVYV